jgi:hypothetical protein
MHVGKRIKERAEELQIAAPTLAKMVQTTKQNMYSVFKRESVDTELLTRIGKALKFNFFAWLADNEDLGTFEEQGQYGISQKEISKIKEENDRLKLQVQEEKEKYALLKYVYKDVTGENPPGSL